MNVLIGKKIGMSQVFNQENAKLTPVTILDVSENYISRHVKNDGKNSHIEIGKDKQKHPRQVDLGQYKNLKFVPQYTTLVKVEGEISEDKAEATKLSADIFSEGDKIEVKGVSKGKGFTGVMKRWNFKGGKATHGQSDRDRAPGSIGSGTTPGRVLKGKKMPGRSGRENQTVKNLKIMHVDAENNLIAVSGSIPGYRGAYVQIIAKK